MNFWSGHDWAQNNSSNIQDELAELTKLPQSLLGQKLIEFMHY